MQLVKQVNGGTVWGVARLDALTGMHIPAEVKDRLPAISWFSIKGVIAAVSKASSVLRRVTTRPRRTCVRWCRASSPSAACRPDQIIPKSPTS
jgi:hypothetical protein